jgi:hypothetical protein
MRLPRVRVTIRRVMVAIAVMAVVFGVWVRRKQFLDRARYYADASLSPISDPPPPGDDALQEWESEQARQRERVEHFERLGLKYERAARYPWLPVAPDPPEPE